MKKIPIKVFEDENAMYCFIVGTDDAAAAEKSLREQENVWFGDDESKWDGGIEKRLPFSDFSPVKFYIRGDNMHWEREELPKGRGRIAVRNGFMASLD